MMTEDEGSKCLLGHWPGCQAEADDQTGDELYEDQEDGVIGF